MTLIYHCRLFALLYGMFVFTSSYRYKSVIDIICITTILTKAILINMVMIYSLFSWLSKIRLIIVLTFDTFISWLIFGLLYVCLHFFLYTYIFNWFLYISTIHITATLINMIMTHRIFSRLSQIRLIMVLTFDSYISLRIVCPSLWNFCL